MFNSIDSRLACACRKIGVETQVDQANPHPLVGMLFDGLQLAVGSARVAFQRGDISAKGHQIGVAVRILDEGLRGSLDLEQGGELAGNLLDLAQYSVLRLTQGNARNDDAPLAEVQKLIEPVAAERKQMGLAATPRLQAA